MNLCSHLLSALTVIALGAAGPASADPTMPIGVARLDVTPDFPRLDDDDGREREAAGGDQRLWAKALAIGGDQGDGPAVLMVVENLGLPASMTDEVAGRLKLKAGLNASGW